MFIITLHVQLLYHYGYRFSSLVLASLVLPVVWVTLLEVTCIRLPCFYFGLGLGGTPSEYLISDWASLALTLDLTLQT